jgi:hypothetical protein
VISGKRFTKAQHEVHDTHPNDLERRHAKLLIRLINDLYEPFGGMTHEGLATGHWTDKDGTKFTDRALKVSIECERSRLLEAGYGFAIFASIVTVRIRLDSSLAIAIPELAGR